MANTARLDTKKQGLIPSLKLFFQSILEMDTISAMLVPRHLPMKNMVMPALITSPDYIDGIDPLAPAFPMNAAKIISKLTRKPMGGKIAAVLRPCEIRAFIELVKLKQGNMDELVIIGIDCLGAYTNTDYYRFREENGDDATQRFCRSILSGETSVQSDIEPATACKACEYPIPLGADVLVGLYGMDVEDHLLVQTQSEKGEDLLRDIALPESNESLQARESVIASLVSERTAFRDNMFTETDEITNDLEKLSVYLADCVNCYNCRVACPVCYCKECVFLTDVFNHDPSQYLRWAAQKGIIKMPTDTLFYHLTRIAHMSTACIGCGQCSNACPNGIPIMELFRTLSDRTQKVFDYHAGRSVDEQPPLSEFRENEFDDIIGINA